MKHNKFKIKRLLSVVAALIIVMSMVSCEISSITDISGDTGGGTRDVVNNDTTTATDTTADSNKSQATIQEKILFEYNGLSVTAKEIISDTIWGAGIKVHIENNSNKDYGIGIRHAIVNNCMITDLFSCTVAAGKKANDTIYLSSSSLMDAGISNIGQIELYFYLYNPNTYQTEYETECVTIKTSHYNEMDTTVENAGHVLYDENGVKIIGKYVDEYGLLGKAIVLYISNSRDENIVVSCDDLSINGYMVTPLLSSTIYANKYIIDDITILRSDLEENDIKEIKDFALKFRVYNANTYQTIFVTNELSFGVE